MAEYDVGPGFMCGDAAHVLLSRAQFIQRFNFNQGALLEHAADAIIILIRETVRQGGYPEAAIRGFHRQNLLHEFSDALPPEDELFARGRREAKRMRKQAIPF
jgi:hypothetical protein